MSILETHTRQQNLIYRLKLEILPAVSFTPSVTARLQSILFESTNQRLMAACLVKSIAAVIKFFGLKVPRFLSFHLQA